MGVGDLEILGELGDINVLDHIIIGGDRWWSWKEDRRKE